ncbi:MAG: hypothetical protein NHB14_27255 [Desulfosporosinus sp.]|nr:hypothetical protein [Methanosarcina sp. ERenArc_MAG2]MCO5388860.1 hypothetical protein [Desulfosporosinus sp.]
MKTQEELQIELNKRTLEAENAILKLDKANMLLGHWMNEYAFVDKPDPMEAVKYWSSKAEERTKIGEQSLKWFHDYGQIIGFVDIVSDYIYESRKLLEKVVYGEKEGAA